MILTAFHGFCMALADSVPGVSGGTIAFILGFYERFLDALHGLFRGKGVERKAGLLYLLKLGLGWDRETIRRRIDERLEKRVREGMIDEVRNLIDAGVSREFLMKLGLEYRFITRYLGGEFSSEREMLDLLATAIKQFAKRQMIWFRRDPDIRWLDLSGDYKAEAMELTAAFLEK